MKNDKKLKFEPNFGLSFFKVLPLLDFRHCYKLSLTAISRKTNYPNSKLLIKLSDRQMDRQTDKSDFIEHCPTNVEHPKAK